MRYSKPMQAQDAVIARIEDELYQEFGSEHPKGSIIFNEGDPGHLVYIIRSGKVQINKSVGDRSKTLALLGPGNFFGEMALISERPRSATATASEDCRLLALNSDIFFKLLRNSYDVTLRIVEQLAARLAEADKRLEMLLFTDATTRLVRYLEEFTAEENVLEPGQIAYELGIPPDRLQRIMAKFTEKGILKPGSGSLTRIDRAKLGKIKNYLLLKEEFGQIE